MATKWVYFFGDGQAEGDVTNKNLLGGKGAGLAEMTNIGIPVPPGFTISTEACIEYYNNDQQYPEGTTEQMSEALKKLEESVGKKFGDKKDPLLVSVRSGARVSMPGMMDTVLNLGLNDETVQGLSESSNNPRFAYDSYRRFIQMFGDVVLGIGHHKFEHKLQDIKEEKGVEEDVQLEAEDMERAVEMFKKLVEIETGKPFPQDPIKQLEMARDAVFGSWWNPRA